MTDEQHFQPAEVPEHLRAQWLAMQNTLGAMTAVAEHICDKSWNGAPNGVLIRVLGDLVAKAKMIVAPRYPENTPGEPKPRPKLSWINPSEVPKSTPCATCGKPAGNHPYRHPFAVETPLEGTR